MVQDSNIGTISAYAEHIKEKAENSSDREHLRYTIWQVLSSADKHITRFNLASRRYARAEKAQDAITIHVERQCMYTSLYEILDTVYSVIKSLDFNKLELKAALDGIGIAGEDSGFVHEVLDRLEAICKEISKDEKQYNLPLNFKTAMDEKEGVNYVSKPHWRDYVAGNIEQSFFAYFQNVQKELSACLSLSPKFWKQRKMQHFYFKRPTLGFYIRSILTATIGTPQKKQSRLAQRIERHTTNFVKKHWPIGRKNNNSKEQSIDLKK